MKDSFRELSSDIYTIKWHIDIIENMIKRIEDRDELDSIGITDTTRKVLFKLLNSIKKMVNGNSVLLIVKIIYIMKIIKILKFQMVALITK